MSKSISKYLALETLKKVRDSISVDAAMILRAYIAQLETRLYLTEIELASLKEELTDEQK